MAQTDRHTDTQTHRHGDYMTESAQWDQLSENLKKYAKLLVFNHKCVNWSQESESGRNGRVAKIRPLKGKASVKSLRD